MSRLPFKLLLIEMQWKIGNAMENKKPGAKYDPCPSIFP